jgi:hypothetical protein
LLLQPRRLRALLSFGWSEQRGVSLSVESAQARVGRPLHGSHMVFQILLSTKRDAVPITHDFMGDFERAAWAKTAG